MEFSGDFGPAETCAVWGLFDGTGSLIDPRQNHCFDGGGPRVPRQLVQRMALRGGQEIRGQAASDGPGRPPCLVHVESLDGLPPIQRRACLPFLRATTVSPSRQLRTETEGGPMDTRLVDLFAPIGRGQRALVVAPPKTGKTTLLQHMARGILTNHPDCHVMVLLVDERPEEVTDFRRTVPAEIFASSNDESLAAHLHVAQFAFRRAQCLAEAGRDVVLFLDSLTRLARAFNGAMGKSGRTMTGGLDTQALEKPRQLFSLARATEEIGSLTVVATILVETGSRMDDLIFQEFKGTGNGEIVLDRRAAERRLFPAFNLASTGTRREELILDPRVLEAAQLTRRAAGGASPETFLGTLLERMGRTPSNRAYVDLVTGQRR